MTNRGKRGWLFWTPRVLTILFAVFISLFALDVFGQGYSVWETVVGLFMHLIPTWIILILLVLAWRWEWVGAVGFIALAVLFVVTRLSQPYWQAHLPFSGPLLLIGLLFLAGWLQKTRSK